MKQDVITECDIDNTWSYIKVPTSSENIVKNLLRANNIVSVVTHDSFKFYVEDAIRAIAYNGDKFSREEYASIVHELCYTENYSSYIDNIENETWLSIIEQITPFINEIKKERNSNG